MGDLYERCDRCLLCSSEHLECVVKLAGIPIATPNFEVTDRLSASDAFEKAVPLELNMCRGCGQLQVGYIGSPEFQYRDYVYTTSLSLGLREHFERYADEVMSSVGPPPGSLVVEIGSNDGTLLRYFRERGMRVFGIDPARRIAHRATEAGIETLAAFFGEEIGAEVRAKHGPAQVVIANNVFANVDNPEDVVKGVRRVLDPDGVFILETQYGADVIEENLLDTVYHEHLSYFMVKPLAEFFERLEMEVIDVQRIKTKGGSIRVSAQLAGGRRTPSASVSEIIEKERRKRMFEPEFYRSFAAGIDAIRRELGELVEEQRTAGKAVAGYGVSIGTTTLLPQFGLSDKIDFLIDDDPQKESVLSGPGYRIPVLAPEAVYERAPGLIVVFAWRYAETIMAKHGEYIRRGGRFVVPLPRVVIH